jgi:ribonuclease P protein component
VPVVPRAVIASPSEVTELSGVDLRFRSAHRLRKTDEYSSVFAFRRALKGRWFIVHYRPNGSDTARLGVVVAKKLARRANLRNLLKRIARENFRLARTQLPALDMVVRLHAKADDATRAMLHEDMKRLFARLPR